MGARIEVAVAVTEMMGDNSDGGDVKEDSRDGATKTSKSCKCN